MSADLSTDAARDDRARDPGDARLFTIGAALAPGATAIARREALTALRSLYAEIAPTVEVAAAPTPSPSPLPSSPLRGVSIDQALDLVIARLRSVAGDAAPTPDPLAQLVSLLGGAP